MGVCCIDTTHAVACAIMADQTNVDTARIETQKELCHTGKICAGRIISRYHGSSDHDLGSKHNKQTHQAREKNML